MYSILLDDDPGAVGTDPGAVLPACVAHWAATAPTRPFIVEVDGRTVSYGEFVAELASWVGWLRDLGVGPGDRVASMVPGSVDAVLLWFAVAYLRAYEISIGPELGGDFLDGVLADSKARWVIIREGQPAPERAGVDVVTVDRSALDRTAPAELPPCPGPTDVASVIYTSGTGGSAKGVVLSWGQLASTIGRAPREEFGPDDAVYVPWPISHVTGRSPIVTMADVGGRVVVRERFSLSRFWPDVRDHGCTSTTVGPVVGLLLGQPPAPDDAGNPLRLVWTSDAGPRVLEFGRRFGVRMFRAYGSTESGFPIVSRDITVDDEPVTGWLRPGYSARITDEHGQNVAAGEAGELLIKPPVRHLVMMEYLDRPEATARAVRDGWYATGDEFRPTPEGGLQFVRRRRDTIRRFGENISAATVEAVAREGAEVLDAAVLGIPSEAAGEEVFLVVEPAREASIDPAALHGRLAERLPRHAVPSRIAVRHGLPRTESGKIRKGELAALVDEAWVSG